MTFDGVFIAEGDFGVDALAKNFGVELDNGFVKVDKDMKTNLEGVFACGDITGGKFQIAKAVYDGMVAGLSVVKYLNK